MMSSRIILASLILCSGIAASAQSTKSHDYDSLGRLNSTDTTGPSTAYNDGEARSYCYDELGNRKALRASKDHSTVYSISACPEPTPQTPPARNQPAPNPAPPTPSNTPPTANNDQLRGACNAVAAVNLTANDDDAEDGLGTVTIVSIGPGAGGSASIASFSSSSATVSMDSVMSNTSFLYTVEDSAGATDTATLTVVTRDTCDNGGVIQ